MKRRALAAHALMAAWFALAGLAFGATQDVRIQIWNETTNSPGTADELNVMTMGRDVEILASEEHVAGEITVPSVEMQQPHLIQAVVGAVKYSHVLMPGTAVGGPVRVSIYDATRDISVVHTHDFRVLFGHDNETQHVMLAATLVNHSSYTYAADGPTWTLAVPDAAKDSLKVELNRGTVPVQVTPEPAGDGRYSVTFDVQPGNTDIEVSYDGAPYQGKAELTLDFPFSAQNVLLLTLPPDIKVLAPPTQDQGLDEPNNIHLYGVAVDFPGTARFAFEGGTFVPKQEEETAEGDVKSVPNPWTRARGLLLLGALLLVLVLFSTRELFRREEPGGVFNLSPAEHRALEERLSRELAQLEARHEQREISEAAYRDQRRRLRTQLALLLSNRGDAA